LLKPVVKPDLLAAILAVLGKGEHSSAPSFVTRHSLRESRRKLCVLVAEDNPVNQTLIVRLLEKMGHRATLASNGAEALALTSSQQFDVVFMDVQMPAMDGLAATRAIREREIHSETHVPIFAMTAHAMKGDRERCLESGMDGYIAKPVHFDEVQRTLDSLSARAAAPPLSAPPTPAPCWSKSEALERLGGDEALLRELCGIFLDEAPKLLAKLHDALTAQDAETVQRTAHSLKGEVSYLGATMLAKLARQLEDMGHERHLEGAAEVLPRLEQELGKLCDALKESPVQA
jgi:CheY-like chemotaxis protein